MIKTKFIARKFCIKILFCNHYFSPLNTFYEKREGSGLVKNGSGCGKPKNIQIPQLETRTFLRFCGSRWVDIILSDPFQTKVTLNFTLSRKFQFRYRTVENTKNYDTVGDSKTIHVSKSRPF
jgi:hypothetical protein